MKRGLVLLHGLPGVGKSTMARELTVQRLDFFYADMAGHPDFRGRSMFGLCAELYDTDGGGRSLITEAVMSRVRHRDTLVAKLINHAAENDCPFDFAVIINLVADLSLLASRRNRSLREYEKLAAAVEVGSSRFPYRTLRVPASESNSLNEDVERLMTLMDECEPLSKPLLPNGTFRAARGE